YLASPTTTLCHPVLFSQHSRAPLPLHPFPTRRSSDLCAMPSNKPAPGLRACTALSSPRTESNRAEHASRKSFVLLIFMTRVCIRSEEHTSELQSRVDIVCRLLLEKKKKVVQH